MTDPRAASERLGVFRFRPAARALVVDPDGRVLLVRFDFGDRTIWATPGGGLEPGETYEEAIRRELAEEVGLEGMSPVGPIWKRTHHLGIDAGRWDGQTELIFLVRSPAFEPAPRHSWAELRSEGLVELRWWAPTELLTASVSFSPRRASPSWSEGSSTRDFRTRSSTSANRWRRLPRPIQEQSSWDLPDRLLTRCVYLQHGS